MNAIPPPDFSGQDLRNRSFYNRILLNANFSHADLRGCDFSRADLRGANFVGARLGWTMQKGLQVGAIALLLTLLLLDAVSRLVFGALGRSPQEPGWTLVLALYAVLGITGACGVIRPWVKLPALQKGLDVLTAVGAGALVGFFYGGEVSKLNLLVAIAAAIVLGGVASVISYRSRGALSAGLVAIAGVMTAYGFVFLMGTTAIHCLVVQQVIWGVIWAGLTLIYLYCSLINGAIAWRKLRAASSTCFSDADLTDAKF